MQQVDFVAAYGPFAVKKITSKASADSPRGVTEYGIYVNGRSTPFSLLRSEPNRDQVLSIVQGWLTNEDAVEAKMNAVRDGVTDAATRATLNEAIQSRAELRKLVQNALASATQP